MASKTTLNNKNLEALGAERLAALLMEISGGNANAKRRLRMELAAAESPDKLVQEIRKRLATIGAATTMISWRTLKAFIADLDSQRRLIAGALAAASPGEALDVMWALVGLGDAVMERTSDTSGEVLEIFRRASDDVAGLATAAGVGAGAVIEPVVQAMVGNGYGQNDGLIAGLAGVLGRDGLAQVRAGLLAGGTRTGGTVMVRRVGRGRRARKLERNLARRRPRAEVLHQALLAIADALGDVDAYMALQADIRQPMTAARVAGRLLEAGRAGDALGVIDHARSGARDLRPVEWQAARMAALDALGRRDEAQAFRLQCFMETLNGDFLRRYLKGLPDFDDIEAEDEALDFVGRGADAQRAFAFLLGWPSLERVARLAVAKADQLDGHDETLVVAAEALAGRYPLAATLVLRRMIDATLNNGRTVDYERAGTQLAECRRLAAFVDDFGVAGDHEAYVKSLRARHPRKDVFWDAAE